MRASTRLAAIGAAMGLSAAAHAAVTVQGINRGTPASSTATATGYTGWTIRLVSDSGNISGVDIQAAGRGIFGTMVQRWTSSNTDGVYDTKSVTGTAENLTPTTAQNFDSHLLPPGNPKNANFYIGQIGFDEDPGMPFVPSGGLPPFPSSTDSVGYSPGGPSGFIKGAFGIDGAVQSSTFDLAYLVVPSGLEVTMQRPFLIAVEGRSQVATAGGTFVVSFFVGIPEPTGLSLIGLGGVGLLNRRRLK